MTPEEEERLFWLEDRVNDLERESRKLLDLVGSLEEQVKKLEMLFHDQHTPVIFIPPRHTPSAVRLSPALEKAIKDKIREDESSS